MRSNTSRVDRARARLCKIAFESLYGPLAWAYDWVSRTFFLGQWQLWQRTAIPFLKGERVLEVGMGTGDMQVSLEKAGFRVWGIDLSPQMLRQARAKSRRLGVTFNMCRARAQALPFPTGCFDSIVSTFPSEYIADPQTLSELSRMLLPGGRLVIVPGGWLAPKDVSGKALEGLARVVYGYKAEKSVGGDFLRRVEQGKATAAWIAALKGGMAHAGFYISVHTASNERGACLIVVAEKDDQAPAVLRPS